MKKLLFMGCISVVIFSCANGVNKTSENTLPDSIKMAKADTQKIDYPYTLDEPYSNWQPGDKKYIQTVLKGLKAYETGDISESMKAFADSVVVRFDGFRAKLSKDSLAKMFAAQRGLYPSVKINMHDWESVISEDKKQEWVTLWYTESWTDKKGVSDSLALVNDLKIENGKIALLDEKIQHFPAKK